MTPEDVFRAHYGTNTNPAFPVVVEYGWIDPGRLAYELHRTLKDPIYGVQVVRDEDGVTTEMADLRTAGTETEVRLHIERLRTAQVLYRVLAYLNMQAQRQLLSLPRDEDDLRQLICNYLGVITGTVYVGNLQRSDETRQAMATGDWRVGASEPQE